jgi:hypothetical protein
LVERLVKSLNAVVSLVAILALRGASQDSSVCSLLTPTDIEAATGIKPGTAVPGGYSAGGKAVRMCSWPIPAQRGQLSLSAAPLDPGMSVATIAKQNPGMNALRKAKYTEESRQVGDMYCSIMTPPPSQKNGVIMSTCTAGVKGTILSFAYISPTKKIALDQAKALMDKAVSRRR